MKKRILSLVLTLTILSGMCAFAPLGVSAQIDDGGCGDNLSYAVSNGVLTISGNGEMYDFRATVNEIVGERKRPWNGDGIKKVIIEKGIKNIGAYAFYEFEELSEVVFKSDIESIGAYAFSDCKNLKSIKLPESVKIIGESSFSYCNSLTEINIPDNVVSIQDTAFYSCSSLKKIKLGENLKEVGERAFVYCSRLTIITLHDKIDVICEGAFSGCDLLTDVTYIGDESIIKKLFEENRKTNELVFTRTEGSYGDNTWKIENDTLIVRGNGKLDWDKINADILRKTNAKNLVIESGITELGENYFWNNHSFEKVVLPNTLEKLGIYTFRGCKNIKEVVCPDREFTIDGGCFEGCINLTHVYIPEKAKLIGFMPFGEIAYGNTERIDITFYTAENSSAYNWAKSNGFEVVVSTRNEYNQKFGITESVILTPIKSNKSSYKEPSFKDIKKVDEYTEYIIGLGYLNLFKGDERGDFNPESTITRAEFSAIVCRMLGYENEAQKHKGKTVFNDVSSTHWASGYIFIASQLGIINGYGNGMFGPEDQVTYEQAIKMLVCAIGYNKVDICSSAGVSSPNGIIPYPDGYMVIAKKYNLIDDGYKIGNNAPRELIAKLLYIALNLPSIDTVGNVSIKGDSLLKEIFGINSEKDIEEIIKGIIDKFFKSESAKEPVEKEPEKKEPIFEIEKIMQKENKTFENEPPIDRSFKKPDLTEEEAFERLKGYFITIEDYHLQEYCGHKKASDLSEEKGYTNRHGYSEFKFEDNNFVCYNTTLSNNEPFIQWVFDIEYDINAKVYYGKKVLKKIYDPGFVVYQCFRIEEIAENQYLLTQLNDNRFMGIGPESWSDDCSYLIAPVFVHNNHIYQNIDKKMTWKQAQEYAKEKNGYLATITSQEENDFLVSHLEKGEEYWIGGYKDNATFNWLTKEPFIFNQTKNDNSNYLTVNGNGIWNSYDSGKRKFVVEYYITDLNELSQNITDFLIENQPSIISMTSKRSYEIWYDFLLDDLTENSVNILGKAINFQNARYNVVDFYSNSPLDYLKNELNGGQDRYTAVLTDALITNATVENLDNHISSESIDALTEMFDSQLDVLEDLMVEEYSEIGLDAEFVSQMSSSLANMRDELNRLKSRKHNYIKNNSSNILTDVDEYYNDLHKFNNNIKVTEENIMMQSTNKKYFEEALADNKAKKVFKNVAMVGDVLNVASTGWEQYATISALRKVKSQYINGLGIIKDKTNNNMLKTAISEVISSMDTAVDDVIGEILLVSAEEFIFNSNFTDDIAMKIIEKAGVKLLTKLGFAGPVATQKVTETLGTSGVVLAVVNASFGLAELIAGTSTEAKAAIDLRILIEIEQEMQRINQDYLSKIVNGQNLIEPYIQTAEVIKPIMAYGSYLTNIIYTAENKSLLNTVKNWALQKGETYSDFDRIYQDEISRINDINFIY